MPTLAEPDLLTLSQRDTVADVWATLTWSPHVSGPSPADLSQRRLIPIRQGMSTTKVKRRVGKYELGRTIGEGTFAKVRFAKNTETGEPVAIKVVDKEKVLKHKMVEQVTVDFTL